MKKDLTKEPLYIDKNEPLYKIVAVVFHLFQNNIFLKNSFNTIEDENFKLKFSKKIQLLDINYYQKDKSLNIKLVNHKFLIKYKSNDKITADILVKFVIEKDENNKEKYLIKTANQTINKLLFFEESLNNNLFTEIELLLNQYFDSTNLRNLKINEFYKIKNYTHLIQTDTRIDRNKLNKFINLIEKFERVKETNTIKVGPLTFIKNKYYSIKFGGITVLEEYSFNKFKYIPHPSLNFILNIIETNNLYLKFSSTINKYLIRTI